jgi:hypothetical protein
MAWAWRGQRYHIQPPKNPSLGGVGMENVFASFGAKKLIDLVATRGGEKSSKGVGH